jgi:phage I-like protein
MKTIMAIEKREDVSPGEGKSKYGDVTFADEKNKKYPLDSETHVRAAWSYINMPKNAAKYSSADVASIKRKIKAAGKKYDIEFSDDGGDKEDKAESSLVYAAATIDLEGETPSEIVFMPKGEEITITPMVSGKAKSVALNVNSGVAEVLQAALAKRLDDPIRPYAGFDHKAGPASFLPKAFKWDDDRGVILEVDWTQAGKDAVAGRNYSYFSPTFLLSGKKVAGLPGTGEVGSLTNNPAFREHKMKIAASAADDETKERNTMEKAVERLLELEIITAEQADDEDIVVKAITDMHATIGQTQAANARLVSENTALQAAVKDIEKSEAETIVKAAIADGKIGSRDQSTIDFWMGQLVSNRKGAEKVLAAMQANPALQKVIDVKVRDGKRTAAGSEADLVQAQHRAVRMVKEKYPGLGHTDAFNRAKEEFPDAFPVEA